MGWFSIIFSICSFENGKFFESNGKKMLYGGKGKHDHFDVSGYSLNDEQFHYGIGREEFPALFAVSRNLLFK